MRGACGAGVLIEPHDPRPERRYKMMYGGVWIGNYESNTTVHFSSDGIHWGKPIRCRAVKAENDTHCNAVWQADLNKYVCIARLHSGEEWEITTAHRREWYPIGERTVGITTSDDFEAWDKAVEVLRGDRMNQTYSMQIFPYGGIYLGLVMMIHLETDRVDCELTWSPDAINWEFVDRGNPIIATSPDPGACDYGCVYAATKPIASDGGIRVYYGASNEKHWNWRDNFLCLAMLRKDGWAGYEPIVSEQSASVTTTPVECGTSLQVTTDAAVGNMRVSILDRDGAIAATSAPLSGAVTDHTVTFADRGLVALAGQLVQLQFELQNAKIYSFSFGN